MFFQTWHGHIELPRRYSMAYFRMRLWHSSTKTGGFHCSVVCPVFFQCNWPRAIFQRFQLFRKISQKTTVKPISPKLQFFPEKIEELSRKKTLLVCVLLTAFFSPKYSCFTVFWGGLGNFPLPVSPQHRGTPRSWINLRTKKKPPTAWRVKWSQGNLFQKTDTSKPLTLLASTEVWSESKSCMLWIP